MWSLDMVRAMNNRPWLMRQLFRIAVGRYAYREFIGIVKELKAQGCSPDFDYNLEDINYHKDPIPKDWTDVLTHDS